jgi:hypothetical protein
LISIHEAKGERKGGGGDSQEGARIKLEAVFHSGPRVRGVSFSLCPVSVKVSLTFFFFPHSQSGQVIIYERASRAVELPSMTTFSCCGASCPAPGNRRVPSPCPDPFLMTETAQLQGWIRSLVRVIGRPWACYRTIIAAHYSHGPAHPHPHSVNWICVGGFPVSFRDHPAREVCYHLLSTTYTRTHPSSPSRHFLLKGTLLSFYGLSHLISSYLLPLFPPTIYAQRPQTGNPQLRPTQPSASFHRYSIYAAPRVRTFLGAIPAPPLPSTSARGQIAPGRFFRRPDFARPASLVQMDGTTHRPSVAESGKALHSASAQVQHPSTQRDLG